MKLLRAIDLAIPAIGTLACGALALAGLHSTAAGAVCGAVVAAASWAGLRLLGRRLVESSTRGTIGIALMIFVKLLVVAALVFVSVALLGLSGIGVAIGLSSLPLGVVLMAALVGPDGRDAPGAKRGAEVEGDA